MYVVVEDRGNQHKMSEGDRVEIALLDANPGETVTFDRVLLYSREGAVQVGRPTVPGARVLAEVQAKTAGPKVIAFKYRKRKASRTKRGHRQKYTRVLVREIQIAPETGSFSPSEDVPVPVSQEVG